MIQVTKTYLPGIEEYHKQLERIWQTAILTNRGQLVLELEERLKNYLKVPHIILMNNGTIPMQIALKALGKGGEIITTPFSYVATTSSIVWEGCKPVFVDIDPEYLTIDPDQIEAAINSKTTCILATHVFGNPCDIEKIETLAKKHGLPVIYDAAHCFGVTYLGKSIFTYGDVSTTSFHATKIFHTAEGGAAFCKDALLFNRIFYSHNFGHKGPYEFQGVGINGKMPELNAAMGLSLLPHMSEIFESRKSVCEQYDAGLDFTRLQKIKIREGTVWNYSYYPVLFTTEQRLINTQHALIQAGIVPRRYFYPSLNTIPYTEGRQMPVSESVATRILCLPLYHNLDEVSLRLIIRIINHALK